MHAKFFRPHQYFSNPISAIITILLLSLIIPRHYAKKDSELYKACGEKITSACGKPIREGIEFPFWGRHIRSEDCGLRDFELSCDESDLVVDIGSQYNFHVVEINASAKVLHLNHNNPLDHICGSSSSRIPDATLNEKLYHYSQRTEHLHLFYHCSDETQKLLINPNFTCPNEDADQVYFFPKNSLTQAQKDELSSCHNTTLPVDMMVLQEFISDPIKLQPQDLFSRSFDVYYNVPSQNADACTDCTNADGLCWIGTYSGSNDTCLYPQSGVVEPENESRGGATYGNKKSPGLIIGVAIGGVGIILIPLALFLFYRRKKSKQGSYAVSRNVSSYSFSMSDSEKGSGTYMGVRTFSYNELEKATNNFDSNNELGDGGFGTVYKGKLQDGREVAVKRLYENSMKRVEQFMNEIVIC